MILDFYFLSATPFYILIFYDNMMVLQKEFRLPIL